MIEGKTKQILPGPEQGTVILRGKDVLTGGDAARVADISAIGTMKTTQAVNVFTLLQDAEIPTAFIRRLDDRSMLCWDCEMLPVEFVLRRFAWGSYLLRHPAGTSTDSGRPQRFDDVMVQRFHKHTVVLPPASSQPQLLQEGEARRRYLNDGVWAAGVYTDPFVEVRGDRWFLHPAKVPFEPGRDAFSVEAVLSADEDKIVVETLLRPAFEVLEQAWRRIDTADGPVVLADCKFEVGVRRTDGAFVLADVVDNDSWRIWPGGDPGKQLDKQSFRDGEPLSKVESMYTLVTELTGELRPRP